MADKEERILIDVVEVGKNCIYRSAQGKSRTLCTHNGLMVQVTLKDCKNCVEGITKQEAIEVIKKSLEQIQCWPNSFNDIIAETALNALLGVEK